MPSYDYKCRDCGKEFTVFLTLKELEERPKIKCPHCECDNVEKKITGFFARTAKKS